MIRLVMNQPSLCTRNTTYLAWPFLLFLQLGCWGPKTPTLPPVIFVVFDTTRVDHLSLYGYEHPTTPGLVEQLADESVLFTRMVAASNNTSCSHASMFTGLHVKSHGVYGLSPKGFPLAEEATTLAEVMKEQGYLTVAAVSAAHLNREFSGFGQGFDRFLDCPLNAAKPKRTARETNRALLPVLDEIARERTGKPLFLFLHYFDPHAGYSPPEDVIEHFDLDRYTSQEIPELPPGFRFAGAEALGKRDLERNLRDYDAEIRHADDSLREVFDALSQNGILQKAIVVFTADHGEELGSHQNFYKHSGLYQPVVHVPLLIRVPGMTRGSTCNALVHHVDLMPTLLDLIGVDPARRPAVEGKSLRSLLEGKNGRIHDHLFSESALFHFKMIRDDRYKLILDHMGARSRLFDIREDPGERKNLSRELPYLRDSLQAKLDDFLGTEKYGLYFTAPKESETEDVLVGTIRGWGKIKSVRPYGADERDAVEFDLGSENAVRFLFRMNPGQSKGLHIGATFGSLLVDVSSKQGAVSSNPISSSRWTEMFGSGLPVVCSTVEDQDRGPKAPSPDLPVVFVRKDREDAERTRYLVRLGPVSDESDRGKPLVVRLRTDGRFIGLQCKRGKLRYKGLVGGDFRIVVPDSQEVGEFVFSVEPPESLLTLEAKIGHRALPNTSFRLDAWEDPAAYPTAFLLVGSRAIPRPRLAENGEADLGRQGLHYWVERDHNRASSPKGFSEKTREILKNLGYLDESD